MFHVNHKLPPSLGAAELEEKLGARSAPIFTRVRNDCERTANQYLRKHEEQVRCLEITSTHVRLRPLSREYSMSL